MKEKDNFILDIKRLGINGEGIGFYNRQAVFVDRAIPGEGHNIEITKVEGNMAFGKTIEIKNVSKYRNVAPCKYYDECGGCNTQHIDYEYMLKLKRDLVIEALNRYTKINTRSFEIKPTVASDNIYNYRNKSQLMVLKNDDGLHVGMLKAGTNKPVIIDECHVQKTLINELNKEILKLASEIGIQPYLAKYGRGVLRYIIIRVNEKNEAMVCFSCFEKNSKVKLLAKETIKLPGVVSVYETFVDTKKNSVFFGDELVLLEGKECIIESIGNIKYQIYPNTFFQLNTSQANKLFEIILKSAKLSFKETILDAYCGVGAIGLYLAHMAKEVIGIEYNKSSVIAANENANLNRIKNAKFLQGDASNLLPKLLEDGIKFDVIVVDPPRTGLSEPFINAILESNVKKVIYVSCNPASLAKDLNILNTKYNINSITPVDMFPQTSLVECVCTLSLKNVSNK